MKLPLTSNGKIDRKYLKNIEIVEDKKEADTKNTINSDSSTYFPIKEIWCKLLQRSDIRPDSDLRSFGADSLIMAQAVGKIRNFLKESGSQCDVPFDILLKQTINSPTLSEIVSYIDQIILKKEVNSRYEDAEVNEEELGKLKIHKKGKEDKLVVIFHAGLGSIDEFLPFIQGLCNEEKGTIVSIALNNVKQYLDFYAGHLYESVADKYTKIILDLGYDKIQLIGHCVGGMIAFEVAKNMMDKGVDVIDVSLIDSIPGKYSIEDEVVMELMFLPMVNITYPVLAEYQLNERELYEYMDEKFGKYTGIEQKSKNKVEEYINGLREIEKEERIRLYINSVSKNMPIQMFVYLFDIFKQSTNGAIYKPIPYLGDIRLFIAEDTEKIVFHRSEEVINFWRENCIGDVTVIMIPGNHLTCFTDVNNIQKLVNMITEK
jgi:pyochelin synthetase